jgi:hypothetical protein
MVKLQSFHIGKKLSILVCFVLPVMLSNPFFESFYADNQIDMVLLFAGHQVCPGG